VEPLVFGAVFIGIPWVLSMVYRSKLAHERYMKLLQLKADLNARLLDRATSDPAALEMLRADPSNQFLNIAMPDEPRRSAGPYARMLTAIQAGCVFLGAGGSFLYIKEYISGSNDQEGILIFGALGVGLGAGAILAAAAAFVVARMNGLDTDSVRGRG
jgi:hypothetical protein